MIDWEDRAYDLPPRQPPRYAEEVPPTLSRKLHRQIWQPEAQAEAVLRGRRHPASACASGCRPGRRRKPLRDNGSRRSLQFPVSLGVTPDRTAESAGQRGGPSGDRWSERTDPDDEWPELIVNLRTGALMTVVGERPARAYRDDPASADGGFDLSLKEKTP